MSDVDRQVADAFPAAMRACRAAHAAGPASAIWQAVATLRDVHDPDALRFIAAVLAASTTEVLLPPAGVSGAPLVSALDYVAAEVAWRASA